MAGETSSLPSLGHYAPGKPGHPQDCRWCKRPLRVTEKGARLCRNCDLGLPPKKGVSSRW